MLIRNLSLFLPFIFLISSCSWWGKSEFNKNKSNTTTIDVDVLGGTGDCLSEIDDFFIRLFKGTSTNFDVSKNALCVDTALDSLFKNALEQDEAKGFHKEELNKLLSKIWKERESKDVRKNVEIIYLAKRLLVGGQKEYFSRKDLTRFKTLLPQLEDILQTVNGHIKFWLYPEKYEDMKESFKVLKTEMQKLDQIRMEQKANFSKKESYDLLEVIFSSETLIKYQALVLRASDVIYGGEEAFSKAQENIFERIHDTLEAQSTARSAKFPRSLFFGNGLSVIYNGIDKAVEALRSWTSSNKKHKVETSLIESIISEIYIINGDKREQHPFASTVKKLVEKYFESKSLGNSEFLRIQNVIRSWYAGQKEIISNYKPKNVDFDFSRYNFTEKQIMHALLLVDILKNTEKSYFKRNVDKTTQYIYLRKDRSALTNDEKYYDLSLKNIFTHISYVAYEAYLKSGKFTPIKDISVSKEKLAELLLDIRPVALDMGIANPYSCSQADNSMMEANLFTSSGNGDDKLSFIEGIELVFMSYSTGSVASRVYNSIGDSCNLTGMNFLGNNFMDRTCVQKSLFGNANSYLNNFPEFLKYYGIIETETSKDDWNHRLGWAGILPWAVKESTPENIQEILFSIVNSCKDKATPITKQELQSMIGLTQYIENWFSLYDKTGQRSLWTGYIWDEPSHDYVIDGREFVSLFNDKLSPFYDEQTADLKKLSKVLKGLLKLWFLRTESGEAIDRYRAFTLLDKIVSAVSSGSATIHSYQNKFCEDILYSVRNQEPISFDDSLLLRCDGSDLLKNPSQK